MFFFLCYNPVISFSKLLKINRTLTTQNFLFTKTNNSYYFIIFFLSFFFLKGFDQTSLSFLILCVFFFYKVSALLFKFNTSVTSNNTIHYILPTFAIFLCIIFFIKSFLYLFFFIELYSVLYYFLFLTSYNFTNQTILKYKNGLLMLLWNNFLTTFFLGLGCFLLLRYAGSLDFLELTYLSVNVSAIYIFLFGLF